MTSACHFPEENCREEKGTGPDRVLRKTVEILGILERMSRGEAADFSEAYADLVGLKHQLGKREEDHKLGESLCGIIGALANNLSGLRSDHRRHHERFRKVRLTKVRGESAVEIAMVGWEFDLPVVGKPYRVIKEDGGTIHTSVVTRVDSGNLQTKNSVYQVEVLEE
jgi:hypothetical protein